MRSWWLCLVLLCLVLFIPSLSFADPPRAYLGLVAGAVYPLDDSAGVIDELELDSGYAFGGVLGLDYGQGRLELEGTYRKADVDRVELLGTRYDGGGEVSAFAIMANAIYSWQNPSPVRPFLLFGMGGSTIDLSDIRAGDIKVVDADDFQFAYQGGAGVEFCLGQSVRLGVEYRYFRVINEEFKDGAGNKFDYGFRTHNALAGIRFLF